MSELAASALLILVGLTFIIYPAKVLSLTNTFYRPDPSDKNFQGASWLKKPAELLTRTIGLVIIVSVVTQLLGSS